MSVPRWIKLVASSDDEILNELVATIEEMGGVDAAQEAFKQLSQKKANWVLEERYVTAKKSFDEILRELEEQAEKDWEDQRPIKREPPPEAPETKEKGATEVQQATPGKEGGKVSQANYVASLLALLLGLSTAAVVGKYGGNLKEALYNVITVMEEKGSTVAEDVKQKLAPEKGKPAEAPEEKMPPQQMDAERNKVQLWRQEAEKETNPEVKKQLEKEIDDYVKEHHIGDM